jgi:hypothetical protein
MPATEKVFFKIHGEDLTRLARTLWADELQMDRAIRLLTTGLQGCNEPTAMSILTGVKKLVGCNRLDLVDDDATQTELGNLLSAESVFVRIRGNKEETEWQLRIANEIHSGHTVDLPSPYGLCTVPFSMTENAGSIFDPTKRKLKNKFTWKDIEPYRQDADERFIEDTEQLEEISGNTVKQNFRGERTGISILDQFIEGDKALTKMEEEGAIPDKQLLSENGWVAPNGDFFPCGPIMHDSLADILLGKTTDAADAIGRRDGTSIIEQTHVRISKNVASAERSSIIFVGREMTQAQKDTIFDWCKKHREDYPTWIDGRD